MRMLRLDPQQGFKKCARVVGDVIGKYHPHGDQAVYDAMVRLAQDFAQRYPLVEGQGNFGNIDGDNAAAYRYTEARLTEVAMALLNGIDEDTVDFRETYNGEDSEPVVLLDGFGYADTHETINSFLWGPDGWLYGNQGVFNSSQIGKPGADPQQRVAIGSSAAL